VLVILLERQLVCLRILKMQVWSERYLFKRKVVFSTSMKCLRIRAQYTLYTTYLILCLSIIMLLIRRNVHISLCKWLKY
jgi:hypothetical protein